MATIDLIIPTVQGREASLERCIESFRSHTSVDFNPIVVPDSKTCGWGWMQGIAASTADYLLLCADDLQCIGESWTRVCVRATDGGLLPCPRVWTPDGRVESQGGDMYETGHIVQRHRKDGSPCDFTTVPFMSREQVEEIGMIPTQYACDVWVSYRGRQLGYDTVLVHGYEFIHHQEQVGRGAGMEQGERDAMDTEAMRRELARVG